MRLCVSFFALNEESIAAQAHAYYAAIKHGGGTVSEDYVIAEICQRYGWTWEQYHKQPVHFIRTISEKLKVEQEIEQERTRTNQ